MRASSFFRIVSIALLCSFLGGIAWFLTTTEYGSASSYSISEDITLVQSQKKVHSSPVVRSITRLAEVQETKTIPRIHQNTQAQLPIVPKLTKEEIKPAVARIAQPVQEQLAVVSVQHNDTVINTPNQPTGYLHSYTVHPNPEEATKLAEALRKRIPHLTLNGESETSAADTTWRLAQIEHILRFFPEDQVAPLQYLTVNMKMEGPRGLGGAHTIIIRGTGVSDDEFISVFIHELGHIIDLGYLKNTGSGVDTNFMDGHIAVGLDDPSRIFYSISWSNTTTQYPGTSHQDFITGYAKSDPFEDFAESFTFYLLHGNSFRHLAQGNLALQEKYNHLKTYVFHDKEFTTGTISVSTAERTWDSTKLPAPKQITIK